MATNHHCTVVEIDGDGILIEGRAGAGKTSLAFGLAEAAHKAGRAACFICDDQALLRRAGGGLVARAPAAIAGKAELRGLGVIDIAHRDETRILLAVRLVPDEAVARMPPPRRLRLRGIDLPLLEVPERHENQAVRIVMAWLGQRRGDGRETGAATN